MILSEISLKSLTAIDASVVVSFLHFNPLLSREIPYGSSILPRPVSRLAGLYNVGMVALILTALCKKCLSVFPVVITFGFSVLVCGLVYYFAPTLWIFESVLPTLFQILFLVLLVVPLDSSASAFAIFWGWVCHCAPRKRDGLGRMYHHPTDPFYQTKGRGINEPN